MGKNRRWQLICILAVTLLTVYNILPTLFYYLKPLREPISVEQSHQIVSGIQKRVELQNKESMDWIDSFCDLLHIHPKKISNDPQNPQLIQVHFTKGEEANTFRSRLPRAGSLIPFKPGQLSVLENQDDAKTVVVQRAAPTHLLLDDQIFFFAEKNKAEYQNIIIDRAAQIVQTLTATTESRPSLQNIQAILKQENRYVFEEKNPIFSALSIDWNTDKITLSTHALKNEKIHNELLVSEVAKINRLCNETVKPSAAGYEIAIHTLPETTGTLVIQLDTIAEREIQNLISLLKAKWKPTHPDFQEIAIVDAPGYEALPVIQKSLCLILSSPLKDAKLNLPNDSLFVIAKGFERIAKNYETFSDSPLSQAFRSDIQKLHSLLTQNGYFRLAPEHPTNPIPYSGDFLFENKDFAYTLLSSTREDFQIRGSKKYAFLELSNREQRVLTENKIDTNIHQELIRWQDDYISATISLNPHTRFDTPKPTKSIFWNNLSLSMRKMLRGDERKIIRWGLDLSGGKSVEIELRDTNQSIVKEEALLKQGVNELYQRVNKMGLSEVSIRQVGEHIVLDFPGSQALSASDLIKASTMYFHVVNEKFSTQNPLLGNQVDHFLQTVWDEAVFTGKTDAQSINEIAKKHLYGNSEEVRALRENGLHLAREGGNGPIDDKTSKIVILRGSSPVDWYGQTHPLLLVFHNYALEGAHLDNVHSAYDPSQGNYLSFSVVSSFQNREGVRINPQNHLHAWTSRYSQEAILGTPDETYSHGRGWRMAVVLNDSVISAPTLNSSIKDTAMINGNFSQTEVQRLCADLKAGSLTYTPHILSEKNVSPELGQTDRTKGIVATVVALILVIVCMIAYYRFAGVIASLAVLFNLLILWATLQNLGATLTLAGIAGIILTVGMSIDANVLVFERIKEEFAATGRIASAIDAGYKKAFSAIIDSNVTTIIAALILLNFDAGPIKSFAMNLIIGIVSSMFTALFVTRFYFTGWAQNPKNKLLKMSSWIQSTKFDFLSKTKVAFTTAAIVIATGGYLLFSQSSSILGLDFTGGYSLSLDLMPKDEKNYAQIVEKALVSKGAENRDFQIREMHPSNQLRVLFAQSMEQKGKPFFGLPLETNESETKYTFEKNPRITWVVEALKEANIHLTAETYAKIHSNWTAVSGQMSDSMRNQAIIGFLLSFVGIFIYLAFRFEYKFAAAALLCLVHDVLITLAIMGLLHAIGVPVQIDLITIAALMTAVGYSLNDTIIIFDRIREEMKISTNRNLKHVVNFALNFTLSRTMITSGTTFLVLIALLILGGASIFGFALVMTIGVIFGTLSSWFIAAPLMLFFHTQEEKNLKIIEKL